MSTHADSVREIYEAFGRGDIPAILERLHPEVAWESWAGNSAQAADVPWLKPRSGRDGVADFFAEVGKLEIREFAVLDVLESGRQVAVEVLIDAHVPQTGGHYRDEELHLWTFDESGQAIRMRHYVDTAKHIRAASRTGVTA
jgi:uncharacterized protein